MVKCLGQSAVHVRVVADLPSPAETDYAKAGALQSFTILVGSQLVILLVQCQRRRREIGFATVGVILQGSVKNCSRTIRGSHPSSSTASPRATRSGGAHLDRGIALPSR
jgi:hypothetical protein